MNQLRSFVRILFLFFLCISLTAGLNAQATAGFSAGAGVGYLKHNFTQGGVETPLHFVAPAPYIAAELLWGNMYLDLSLGLLLAPSEVDFGSDPTDLTGYVSRLGFDFNAIGIGYLHPVNEKLGAGGALGFHVSSVTFTPEDTEDVSIFRIGGNYGAIGLDLVPRFRYAVSNSVRITVSLPLGIDFAPMSDDVVVGGVTVGESPAIIQPATLVPEFSGWTAGLYLTAGYFFQLKN
ncbi:MAG: hypothetical protein R2751_13635 [Bacteroidales bacterium]